MVFLIFVCLLIGCSPIVDQGQQSIPNMIPLYQGRIIGQSFVSEFDGLSGFQVYIDPLKIGDGKIILSIESFPELDGILGQSSLPIREIPRAGYYNFQFTPIKTSHDQDYMINLVVEGPGSVNVGISPRFSYLNGAIYIDGQAEDHQMAFNLLYNPAWVSIGIMKEVVRWIMLLIMGFLVFVIPGWGMLSHFWSNWDEHPLIEKILLSAGTSIAIYPVLLLWIDLIGWKPGFWIAYIPILIGLAVIFIRNRNILKRNPRKVILISNFSLKIPTIIFLLLAGIIVAVRYWSIRIVDTPLWGDSYHHTLISKLIVDNGGLFTSWEPYADLSSFTYHFGFHVSAAVYHWITNLDMSDSVLWFGQLLNIFAVLVLYPLAVKLGGNRWTGLVTILVSGLLLSMPMFYVNWGRYTQLAGQVILPVVLYFLWHAADSDDISWGTIVITAVLLSGLALTHYRVLFFALFFIPVIILFHLEKNNIFSLIQRFALIGAGSLLLFLPWLIRVYGGTILQIFGEQITTSASSITQSTLDYNTIGDLTLYLPAWAWITAGAAAVLGFIKRPRSTLIVMTWCLLLLIGANPNWIGLPGAGTLSNFALFIAAYIPASLLIGLSSGVLLDNVLNNRTRYSFFTAVSIYFIILVLAIWGMQNRVKDINLNIYALVTRPDLRAMNWIEENIPNQSKFLVNSFLAYDGTLAVGSDGGLWLPLLAERKSTLPPITYGFEQSKRENKLNSTNQFISTVMELGPTHPVSVQLLQDNEVTHVYIGQRRGRVNYSGPDILDPNELAASSHFTPIYHQDLVWIFRLIH